SPTSSYRLTWKATCCSWVKAKAPADRLERPPSTDTRQRDGDSTSAFIRASLMHMEPSARKSRSPATVHLSWATTSNWGTPSTATAWCTCSFVIHEPENGSSHACWTSDRWPLVRPLTTMAPTRSSEEHPRPCPELRISPDFPDLNH